MLSLIVTGKETWDPVREEFVDEDITEFKMEHSLVAISKWEAKYHKSFMNTPEKTSEEMIGYFRFMMVNKNINEEAFKKVITTERYLKQIKDYMEDPMTATTFSRQDQRRARMNQGGEYITSETIYYWMVTLNIPFDPCEKWHITRLLTLIQFCNLKNSPPKKMSRSEIYAQNKALNEARKAKYHTKG